jgi:transcriptional regulator with PAS, ATPase and Fis domain
MASPRVPGVRRLDAWLQHAREPVFVLNAECRLVYVNRAWEELTGYAAEAVLGRDCRPLGRSQAGEPAGLGDSFNPPPEALAGQPAGVTTLIVHAQGERRWRRLEFWPYHDAQGALLCLLGLVRQREAPPHTPDAESQRLHTDLMEVRDRLLARNGFDALIGRGPGHQRLLDQVRAAAATTVPVLVVGGPGTGKRLVARTIQQQGPHPQSLLLAFDCAALPPEDLERDLFGVDGSRETPGLALPGGSTLLLKDVLDLPRDMQGRLVAALSPAIRLLATTSGDPERARLDDRLRPDFYYALTTLVIRLAPLRDRLDELPLLAQHLLERANQRGGRWRGGLSPEALDALIGYDWPGNVRELARVIDAAHARGGGDVIGADDLPAAVRGHLGSAYTPPPMPPAIMPLDELLTQVERRLIEQALQRAGQNKSRAAELLDISRPRLYRRIKELNIPDVPEPADDAPRTPTLNAAP